MNTTTGDDDSELIGPLVAARPDQNDALARALRETVRRDVLGVAGEPFRLGRFTVLGPLGGGGMGTVFVAYDPDLDRKIALKVLHTRGERGRREVLREGRALARLKHPGVVTVYEVGVVDEQVFVAMEYVAGTDLRAWLRAPQRTATTLALLVEAGRGLAAAHDADVVHLDVKPENIVVDAGGHARVVDFGLARSVDELDAVGSTLQSPSEYVSVRGGTPAYMAPERLAGRHDARSDQYSYCVTCWEALFGRRPRPGEEASPGKASVSPRVVRALRRGMSPTPAQRFPSMHALLAELDARPTRRWLRGAAALGVAAAVAGAYAVGQRDTTELLCSSPWQPVANTWSPERAEQVGAAFVAVDVPFARATWATARAALDRYADAWDAAHARACDDARVRGSGSRELHLAALVERFAEADAKTVNNAGNALDRLPPIEACGDLSPVGRMFAGEPDRVDALLRLRGVLARARVEVDTGRPGPAEELLADALTRARTIDDPTLLAEVLILAGTADRYANKLDRSFERTREALTLAVAHGDALQSAAATLQLVQLRHVKLRDTVDNDDLLALAEAFLRRAGDPPAQKMALMLTRGTELLELGRFSDACTHLQRAVAFAEQNGLPRGVGGALANIGKCRDKLGDYAGAVEALSRALTVFGEQFGPQHPYIGILHLNLGSSLIAHAKHEEARGHFEQAIAVATANYGGDHPIVEAALLDTGISYAHEKRHEEALAAYQKALAVAERLSGPDSGDVVHALCNMGESLRALGRLDEALAANERATRLQAASVDEDNCDVLTCSTIHGAALLALARHADARRILEPLHERFTGLECDPNLLGQLEVVLAETLWTTPGTPDRQRALTLLTAASGRLTEPTAREELERVRALVR